MKIFFFTTVFSPSVGGIERLAETLCGEFANLGHEVRLATLTEGLNDYPYQVRRKPGFCEFVQLLRWCDVHIQANISLKYAYAAILSPRKVLYQHNNTYKRDDGALSILGLVKRTVARYSPGVAVSHYVAASLDCNNVILNCYKDDIFTTVLPWEARERELVFVGRLVSQKGCDTLLQALGRLAKIGLLPRLTIIGDGPDKRKLEELAANQGISRQVRFEGVLEGIALASALNDHRMIVIPSTYEEPFGIVGLEGLACGCVPVVSAHGGLVDAIGSHGFTFANGDAAALAQVLNEALSNPDLAQVRLQGAEAHLAKRGVRRVAQRYVEVLESVRNS